MAALKKHLTFEVLLGVFLDAEPRIKKAVFDIRGM